MVLELGKWPGEMRQAEWAEWIEILHGWDAHIFLRWMPAPDLRIEVRPVPVAGGRAQRTNPTHHAMVIRSVHLKIFERRSLRRMRARPSSTARLSVSTGVANRSSMICSSTRGEPCFFALDLPMSDGKDFAVGRLTDRKHELRRLLSKVPASRM